MDQSVKRFGVVRVRVVWCIIMGDYCAPARGTMKIMRPEGHIMPPSGGIMQPEGGIMFPEGLHNFHWPEGRAQ